MYAATGDAIVVLDEHDGRWSVRAALEGSGAQCVAAGGDGVVVAGARLGGVWWSADRGRTWAAAGLTDREIFSVAVSPADGTAWSASSSSQPPVPSGLRNSALGSHPA